MSQAKVLKKGMVSRVCTHANIDVQLHTLSEKSVMHRQLHDTCVYMLVSHVMGEARSVTLLLRQQQPAKSRFGRLYDI